MVCGFYKFGIEVVGDWVNFNLEWFDGNVVGWCRIGVGC